MQREKERERVVVLRVLPAWAGKKNVVGKEPSLGRRRLDYERTGSSES